MKEEYIHLNSFIRCSVGFEEPQSDISKPRSVPRISEAYSETDEQENEVSKSSSDNKLSLVNFIYENENSIPDVLCDNIIELYDSEENKHPGSTHGGVQKQIKDTTDFNIPKKNKMWEKINNFLLQELHKNLKLYHRKMNQDYKIDNLLPQNIFIENFMVQHYKKGVGKYLYHNDGHVSYNLHKRRIITYIFYLNDVNEGGETEFFKEYTITPKKGKIVLFPANWCYPHCGKMPVSNDKYIITGWVYTDQS